MSTNSHSDPRRTENAILAIQKARELIRKHDEKYGKPPPSTPEQRDALETEIHYAIQQRKVSRFLK